MLVLDAEDISRHQPTTLTPVVSLTKMEAATLFQAWEHAVKVEGLEWLYVADVYVSTDSFFYFYSEKGLKGDFNIFDFINRKCSTLTEELNSLTAKAILGIGKGVPEHSLDYRPEPEPARFPASVPAMSDFGGSTFADVPGPVWGGGVSPSELGYLEDDERTGLLNEDDIVPPRIGTAYELHLEGAAEKYLIRQKEYTVGRSESADWRILGNKSISRFHAKIWVDADDRLMVVDTGSSNGVFVDAIRISSTPVDVSRASVITFGNAKVRNLGVRQVAY